MRNLLHIAAGAALLVSGAALAAPKVHPEARLALALEGRVAGKPVDCINLRNVRSTQIIDNTAILYEAGGSLYVNRPRAGRESLDRWDTLVTRLHNSRLCSIDVVRLYDSSSRMETGFVFLGDFVPYRKPKLRR